MVVDTGFEGIHRFHQDIEIPKKKRKKNPLTKQEKKLNRQISSKRAKVENIIGFVKRFKIVADRYRNRRKRFGRECKIKCVSKEKTCTLYFIFFING